MEEILIGILTVSDRASRGEYEDRGGPAVRDYLASRLVSPFQVLHRIVPDDQAVVRDTLASMADREGCSLIVTTGGTGPSPRDCTPDATREACDKILPGFGEQMRRVSVGHVPTALLSRQIAGFRKSSLILNLPGNPRAIQECLDAVFDAVPHCIELIGGPGLEIRKPPDLPH